MKGNVVLPGNGERLKEGLSVSTGLRRDRYFAPARIPAARSISRA